MSKYKVELNGTHEGQSDLSEDQIDHNAAPSASDEAEMVAEKVRAKEGNVVTIAATLGVVVIGAAVIEATLIPGILVGAAAAFAPKYLPKLGERMQPLFNSTVRGACKLGRKARAAYGEAHERVHDIAAEVHAEETAKATESAA